MPRKILIAIDGSDNSLRALTFYAENMNQQDDFLVFVYAIEPPNLPRGTGASLMSNSQVYTDLMKEAVAHGKKLSKSVRDRCTELELRHSNKFIERVTSKPGVAIVEAAKEENIDIIIMGNRGMGTLRRTFLGSVSDFVLHHSHRPVLIIPPEKSASRRSSVDSRKSSTGSRKGANF